MNTGDANEAGGTQESLLDPVDRQTPEPKEVQGQETTPAAGDAKGGDDWKTAMKELAETVKSSVAPKKEEKAPTQDEINEFWAVYNPTKAKPDFFDKMFLRHLPADMDPTERKAIVEETQAYWADMQQGLMRQAVTAAKHLMAQEMQKLREEFEPVKQVASQTSARETRARFSEKYPALADEKYNKILRIKAQEISVERDAGKRPEIKSDDDFFKALAESAAEDIRALVPDFDLGSVKQSKSAVTTPRLPRTSAGGTGGSGSGRTPTKVPEDDSAQLSWMA